MPTYHNVGCGYPNVSASAGRHQSKLDGNQNHHMTISSHIVAAATAATSHIVCPEQRQSISTATALLHAGMTSSPTTTTSTTTITPITTNMTSFAGSTNSNSNSNSNVNSNLLVASNARHEVKLNAMPYVIDLHSLACFLFFNFENFFVLFRFPQACFDVLSVEKTSPWLCNFLFIT